MLMCFKKIGGQCLKWCFLKWVSSFACKKDGVGYPFDCAWIYAIPIKFGYTFFIKKCAGALSIPESCEIEGVAGDTINAAGNWITFAGYDQIQVLSRNKNNTTK